MNDLLQSGQILHTIPANYPCQVGQFLGGGGQGEVYQATLLDQPVALKWYFPQYLRIDTKLEQRLEQAILAGAPNERFLWPTALVKSPSGKGLGYLMPLRDSRYRGFADLLRRKIEPSFRALSTAGLELASSFKELHSKGLCYCDISFGNVFIQPETGEILICDNDNVDFDKASSSLVLGTQDFMAPEIVRRQSRPCRETDLFSLSVLLFYMFMAHHPLQGKLETEIKCLDLPAREKLYGINPVFIFDPDDDSNRPVPEIHPNPTICWPIYPQFLRNRFTTAFTKGIRSPNWRVEETEWQQTMVQLRDSIIYCPHCEVENFYDASKDRMQPKFCWNLSCRQKLQVPLQLHFDHAYVMLNYDAKLFPHHIDLDVQHRYDFSKPVAAVVRHPSNPVIWGLKNLSDRQWMTTTAGGSIHKVDIGQTVTLSPGTKINFGRTEGILQSTIPFIG